MPSVKCPSCGLWNEGTAFNCICGCDLQEATKQTGATLHQSLRRQATAIREQYRESRLKSQAEVLPEDGAEPTAKESVSCPEPPRTEPSSGLTASSLEQKIWVAIPKWGVLAGIGMIVLGPLFIYSLGESESEWRMYGSAILLFWYWGGAGLVTVGDSLALAACVSMMTAKSPKSRRKGAIFGMLLSVANALPLIDALHFYIYGSSSSTFLRMMGDLWYGNVSPMNRAFGSMTFLNPSLIGRSPLLPALAFFAVSFLTLSLRYRAGASRALGRQETR